MLNIWSLIYTHSFVHPLEHKSSWLAGYVPTNPSHILITQLIALLFLPRFCLSGYLYTDFIINLVDAITYVPKSIMY